MAENDKKGTVGQTSDPVSRPHTQEEIVPSSTPLTIPYFEVYRTNELEYTPYQSPYLNQSSTSSGDGSSDSDTGDGSDSSGGSGSSQTAQKQVLWTALAKIVNEYYPASKNQNYWIGRFRDADLNWTSVARVVNKMGGNAKKQNTVTEKVLQAKEQYAKISRGNYKTAKGIAKVIGKGANTTKGKLIVSALKKDKNNLVFQKWAKDIETISKISK